MTYAPLEPPPYPLVVRDPYLSDNSAKIDAKIFRGKYPSSHSPALGGIESNVRNHGSGWWHDLSLLGVSSSAGVQPATVPNSDYTSTHMVLSLLASNISIKLDFLCSESPSNYLRQCFPFGYFTVPASDAAGADVQNADIDETAVNATESGQTSIFQMSVDGAETYTQNAMD